MPQDRLGDGERELDRVLADFQERYPHLGQDEIFVLWFLRAFVAEDESAAVAALCGGPGDKGVDAVFIDEPARIVFVIQGKRREKTSAKREHRSDVMGFAELALAITGDEQEYANLTEGLSSEVQGRLQECRQRILKRNYSLQMLYVTSGRCATKLKEEARRRTKAAAYPVTFQLFDGKQLLLLLGDYLDGVAPPVPSLDLEIESGGGVKTSGVFNRFDSKTGIDSWVFSMTDSAVAGLYERAGTRLFARNVRGFLGNTEINRGMESTLGKEPEYFWYYNNGITVICDDATLEARGGREILRVTNPQVINGQQTTRTLSQRSRKEPRASVLVRVIRVPRSKGHGSGNHFDMLVSRIVSATNWQNAIKPSDLMSNDRRQVEIERELRKLNYLYLRKRMTKGEARRISGRRHLQLIKKEELAQAVAACDLDPLLVREGKERLFEERWYGLVFPNHDPDYYLPRYWLMRQVSYTAKGYPERAYAKWLALNFSWRSLAPLCDSAARAKAFREACEKNKANVLTPLRGALSTVFAGTLRFYRANRGSGPTATDVSTFFKRRNLAEDFQEYWRSGRNKSRAPFRRNWNRFEKGLRDAVER